MYSISQALDDILMSKPYFSELLEHDLLNITQLARHLRPEIEDRCMKATSVEAIAMAIRRAPKCRPSPVLSDFFKQSPDIMVRSHLSEITVKKRDSGRSIQALLDIHTQADGQFFTITHGIFEDTMIVSKDTVDTLRTLIGEDDIIAQFDNLVAVTVRLDPDNVKTPGVYYSLLKPLMLEHINVIEVVSTYLECTLLVADHDAERTFAVVKRLFRSP